MKVRAKRLLIITAVLCGIFAGWIVPAMADNYVGKVDLVAVKAQGTRFLVRSQGLSLYAKGEYRDVLLQGFYKKSNFSIGYTPITCPGGITGRCGQVNFVTVDVSNF